MDTRPAPKMPTPRALPINSASDLTSRESRILVAMLASESGWSTTADIRRAGGLGASRALIEWTLFDLFDSKGGRPLVECQSGHAAHWRLTPAGRTSARLVQFRSPGGRDALVAECRARMRQAA